MGNNCAGETKRAVNPTFYLGGGGVGSQGEKYSKVSRGKA